MDPSVHPRGPSQALGRRAQSRPYQGGKARAVMEEGKALSSEKGPCVLCVLGQDELRGNEGPTREI